MSSWAQVSPVFEPGVRELCRQPYPGHPRGCPNYGKKAGCPPRAPLLTETLDSCHRAYVIYNAFPIGQHAHRMKAKHPQWSERQAFCCLYWQPKARKELEEKIAAFRWSHPGLKIIRCPEAQGVNVTATMKKVGIKLEWPPRILAYQVALAVRAMEGEK